MRTEAFIGFDSQGDACIFVQVLDDKGDFVRYLSEEELARVVDSINEHDFPLKPDALDVEVEEYVSKGAIWDGKSVAGGTFERGE